MKYTITFLLICQVFILFGQCPNNGFLTFSTQENLDNFAAGYPNCQVVNSIYISGNEIVDLSPLSQITTVNDNLAIINPGITSLNGLHNITTIVGTFSIYGTNGLSNLNGFEDLVSVGNLWVEYNIGLQDFSGLENLTSINGNIRLLNTNIESFDGLPILSSLGSLSINNCSFKNLGGLENLTEIIQSLAIINNSELESLTALNNLNYVGSTIQVSGNQSLGTLAGLENVNLANINNLTITNNNNLSICNEINICNYIGAGHPATIENNAIGCNEIEDLLSNCTENRIHYNVFYDVNQNGIKDEGEFSHLGTSVNILPSNHTAYVNSNNGGFFFTEENEITVNYIEPSFPGWELTTDFSSYNVSFDNNNNSTFVEFGIYPMNTISEIITIINAPPARCLTEIPIDMDVYNSGNTIASGTLWLQIDPNVSNVNYTHPPDSIIGDYVFGWNFSDLYPGQHFKREILLTIPGPPDFTLFTDIYFSTYVNYHDVNGTHEIPKFLYPTVVQCAFDPNDKLVNPDIINGYALMDKDLTYTIRFQNTGNAEAYDVTIRDTLDDDLDVATFKVISSSHEEVLTTTMDNNKYLTFDFRNIYLPDSTTNFEASQGYVSYTIRAKEGLPEATPITNSASIYFDFNPPILTNTTQNIMLSTFDFDEDGYEFFVDCDDNNAAIYPDAIEIPYNGIDEDCNPATLDDDLDQDGFIEAEDCDDNNALVNSTAIEIPYNGLDDDCNPLTLEDDFDQDGFSIVVDCDDENPFINVFAEEIPNNGIDEDCDGEDLIANNVNDFERIDIQIFPNPTSDLLQVILSESIEGIFELRDIHGKIIQQGSFKNEINTSLKDYTQGVYLLIVQSENNAWTEQVLKI